MWGPLPPVTCLSPQLSRFRFPHPPGFKIWPDLAVYRHALSNRLSDMPNPKAQMSASLPNPSLRLANRILGDEQKPQCSQCRKGGRQCRPSEGIVFRHQQNASMNNQGEENPEVVFVDNSDPYADELETSLAESNAMALAQSRNQRWESGSRASDAGSQTMDALSAVGSHERYPYSPLDHPSAPDSVSYPSPKRSRSSAMLPPVSPSMSLPSISLSTSSHNTNPNHNNINFLLNPSSQSISPSIASASVHTPRPQELLPSIQTSTFKIVAFLLRHYSEGPGLWMDLYDLGTYFASDVPVRATSNPLLKYAACAYAAKQLGRVKGAKTQMGGTCTRQAAMEVWSDKNIDFLWCGAKYYEKAIQLLQKELQPDPDGPPPLSTPEAFGQWQANELCDDGQNPNPRKRRRRLSNNRLSHGVHSDEVLAATAILSVYEFLDATGQAWSRHLSGVKSLLDVAEIGVMPLESRSSDGDSPYQTMKKSGFSKARKAAFWNFARQDYLAALINECHTRLNTEDLALWTEAGLQIDQMGFIRPSNTAAIGYPEGDDIMKEDLICNALVWILSKIVNFVSSGDTLGVNGSRAAHSVPLGVSQQMLLERWHRLELELDHWYKGLPDTFQACARIEPAKLSHYIPAEEAKDLVTLQEVWHSIPMCASSMQHYHMARILLLVNKPHGATSHRNTINMQLQSYRSIEVEIGFHSREIVGIALSRPVGSVRINSLQPLFVSGQCLTDARERRTNIRLLRAIESDLGWATEYRVQQLLKEWGWDESFLQTSGT
ncbi:transcriptional regulator family: Fungal Specific TF [Penicillium chermesinum]|uniref:Transcriptional regulator family: Fungal Specific TF n=1 Tax=Penicillium chermesinum TaxID=63820 RepID=A0A9W9P6B0_9EURO|nr:transcriptional regulator family: Fungal Specific TF [Penicillium chermesinum]KAJ5238744.1 transcriptional regulator family: Fungal Specific TF [Penicillium chermesinum]